MIMWTSCCFLFIMLISSLYSFEIRKEKNGPENLRYGDIMLTEAQRRRIDLPRNASRKLRAHFRREAITMPWINAVVPYTLSPKFGLMEKMTIQKAMRKIEKVSCFKFKQRSLEIDYLTILPLDGCYSYVGRIGGAQDLSLSRGCMYEFIIIHELLHAIGFEHEHQRFDRDNFIQIVYKNIEPSQYHNFDKVNIHEVTTFNYKYDLKSIMHYDETAFGKVNHITKKKLVTMIPLDKSISLDDNLKLSSWDIEKLNIAGNCQSKEIENVVITEKDGNNNLIENKIEKPILLVVNCLDVSPFCHLYLTQGLCYNPSYIQLTKSLCPKTCFNCMAPI